MLRYAALVLLAFALQAQETSAPTVEQQLAQKDAQIAFLQRKLQIYQQAAFACQDARIDEQVKQQAKPTVSVPGK